MRGDSPMYECRSSTWETSCPGTGIDISVSLSVTLTLRCPGLEASTLMPASGFQLVRASGVRYLRAVT